MSRQISQRAVGRSMLGMIGTTLTVVVDRPLGSRHPRHAGLVYKLNYGFVPGTAAPDGSEIDAYVMGVEIPLETFEGRCIAVLHREDDVEDKLVVVPLGADYSHDEIQAATWFQERYFHTRVLRHPDDR